MYKLRGLTIDNGGSEVRVLPLGTLLPFGRTVMSNDFARINKADFRPKETDDVLDLCDIISAPSDEFKGIIARGTTAKMYHNEAITIDSQSTKTGNINYYRQLVYAIARDAIQVCQEGLSKKHSTEQTSSMFQSMPFSSTEDIVDYVLVTCIPIKEHSGKVDCANVLKESVMGEYSVEFPLVKDKPNTVKFRILPNNIGVVPEGGVAMSLIRNKVQSDDISLLVDVGHITTDIALFKGTSLLGRVISSPYAGSTLLANVRSTLADEGYFLNEEQTLKAIESGTVSQGSKTIDVKKILNKEKEMFVKNYLKSEIVQILNMNACNSSQVQNVIPIGAPMNGDNEDSIAYTLVKECKLNNASIKRLAEDLRYVNLEAASKFTRLLFNNAKKQQK